MNRPLNTNARGLPASLAPCFQEYDFESLDPELHRELVIERTLAYGGLEELRWLFERYARAEIAAWVTALGQRRLPWRRYHLWCLWLDLPPAQRRRAPGERIWPY
jgi:hypothetical protein